MAKQTKVALYKRVTVDGKQKFVKASKKGEGAFYLSWYEGDKKRWLAIPETTMPLAENARVLKQARLQAEKLGIVPAPAVAAPVASGVPAAVPTDGRVTVVSAAKTYLDEIKNHKDHKTHASYRVGVERFLATCAVTYVDEVNRTTMLHFLAQLRAERKNGRALSDKTISNQFKRAIMFLHSAGRGAEIMGLKKEDYPKFVEHDPEVYSHKEIAALLKVADADERVWLQFFLFSGFRREETENADWSWVNFDERTIEVQENRSFGYTPKANHGRVITMAAPFVELLQAWQEKTGAKTGLIFQTEGGKPQRNFYDMLKVIAERAGLDAEKFWLHKFRATFATLQLHGGTDLRTVQDWLGHSPKDLKATMRYLTPARGKAAQAKADNAFEAYGAL